MKVYAVGGAVRDKLLGLPVIDRDYVVVGATPDEMISLGYQPVGRDFPVFLHPQTHQEYALARTERKTARGYHGFEFQASPEVTLEQDLARRDLTINAIAKDESGRIVDPYNGRADITARVLRHVGPAFIEDPVRILRVARFAARFDFAIAPETMKLMSDMVVNGETGALVAERVWQELSRGLMERLPSRMFATLTRCGALAVVLPEIAHLYTEPAQNRTAAALDAAAARGQALAQRFALACLGAAESALAALCERIRAPQDCRDMALLAAKFHGDIGKALVLDAAAVLRLLQATDALRRPARFVQLLEVCALDTHGAALAPYPPAPRLVTALAAARAVDAGTIAREARDSEQIRERVTQARLTAIQQALDASEAGARNNPLKGAPLL